MICRIRNVTPLPDYKLYIVFDDGKRIMYDVKEDMTLPGYDALRTIPTLFEHVQLDTSRTCIYWNEDIDLPSDMVYEYGKPVEG